MHLVALPQAAQDRDRLLDRRLVHVDGLETALQRGVLLDVLAVLVERGGTDGVQLPAGQHRLEEVGRVHGAFRGARPDHGMQLVDEEDHLALGIVDLLEDGLEALLELATILRTGNQRPEVERDDAFLLEALRHVAPDDALSEAFHHGRLADARLADQHRVVLGAPRQDLDDAADLIVAPDDRVQLAIARVLGQVAAVLLQRLVGGLGVLRGHPLAAADALQRLKDRLVVGPGSFHDALRVAAGLGRSEEQVLRRDVLVLEALCLVLGALHELTCTRVEGQTAALDAGPLREHGAELHFDRGGIRTEPAQRHRWNAFRVLEQRGQDVLGVEDGAVLLRSEALRCQDRLLGLLGVSVELHGLHPRALRAMRRIWRRHGWPSDPAA